MSRERFDTWEEAYDCCREGDTPMVVRVGDETGKVFPSGSYQFISGIEGSGRETLEVAR